MASVTATASGDVELRPTRWSGGWRETLIELFDEQLVAPQEALGWGKPAAT